MHPHSTLDQRDIDRQTYASNISRQLTLCCNSKGRDRSFSTTPARNLFSKPIRTLANIKSRDEQSLEQPSDGSISTALYSIAQWLEILPTVSYVLGGLTRSCRTRSVIEMMKMAVRARTTTAAKPRGPNLSSI